MKNEIAAPDHLLIFASPPRLCQTLSLSILTSQTLSLLTSRQLTFSIEPPPTKTQAYLLIWAAPHHASLMPFSPSPSIADPLMPISPSPSMAAHHASLMPISLSLCSPPSVKILAYGFYFFLSTNVIVQTKNISSLRKQTEDSGAEGLTGTARWILNFDEGIFSPTFLLRIGCKIKCFFKFLNLWVAVLMGVQLLNSFVVVLMGIALFWLDFVLAWFCFVESVVCCVFKFLLLGFYFGMANGSISTVMFFCLCRFWYVGIAPGYLQKMKKPFWLFVLLLPLETQKLLKRAKYLNFLLLLPGCLLPLQMPLLV